MIELRHFRCFVVVAEELNFRRASERIHIDQSPLSRATRDLEDELGGPLLVRLPRALQLTPAGHKLLKEFRMLLVRMERIKRTVRQTHALYQAPLSIGIADGIAQPKLSECLNRWRLVGTRGASRDCGDAGSRADQCAQKRGGRCGIFIWCPGRPRHRADARLALSSHGVGAAGSRARQTRRDATVRPPRFSAAVLQ